MPCDIVRIGESVGVICTRGRGRKKPCFVRACPGPAHWQCDYPVAPGKTCDRHICERHRRGVGPDKDYCLEHFYADRKKNEVGDGSERERGDAGSRRHG